MPKRFFPGLLAGVFAASLPASAQTFDVLLRDPQFAENQWRRLNQNLYGEVWPADDQIPRTDPVDNRFTPAFVILAWSSFVWDSNRDALILHGGGHANYPGNEVYRWRADTLRWERASLPSDMIRGPNRPARYAAVDGVDAAPNSAHTYDMTAFLPIADRYVSFGGAGYNDGRPYRSADLSRLTGPYFWDPAKADGDRVGGTTGSQVNPDLYPDVVGGNMWENRDSLQSGLVGGGPPPGGSGPDGIGFLDSASAYVAGGARDRMLLTDGSGRLWRYTVNDVCDASADRFEAWGSRQGQNLETTARQGPGAYDPDRNIFLRIAAGFGRSPSPPGYRNQFVYWDLSAPGPDNRFYVVTVNDPTGTFDLSRAGEYGMDYDPRRKNYLLWRGDGFVWRLLPPADLRDAWTLQRLQPGGDVPPAEALGSNPTGVLGKWKYIARYDLFLGLSGGTRGDVWAYKPVDWQPREDAFAGAIFVSSFEDGDGNAATLCP